MNYRCNDVKQSQNKPLNWRNHLEWMAYNCCWQLSRLRSRLWLSSAWDRNCARTNAVDEMLAASIAAALVVDAVVVVVDDLMMKRSWKGVVEYATRSQLEYDESIVAVVGLSPSTSCSPMSSCLLRIESSVRLERRLLVMVFVVVVLRLWRLDSRVVVVVFAFDCCFV